MRKGTEPIDLTVERDGTVIVLPDVKFPVHEENGIKVGMMDFIIYSKPATVTGILSNTLQRSYLTVRMVWESLFDLISGRYSIDSVSGPVGITATIVGAADDAVKVRNFSGVFYITAIICINLGVMNLLPIPALDGGRLFFVLIELIFRRPVPSKIENAIHAFGMYFLLLFMLFISLKDIFGIFF